MKKLFSLLLAVAFVASAFCIPASASYADGTSTAYFQYGTTAHDLQAYGLHTFRAFPVATAPSINGEIATGEYGTVPSDVATLGDGLSLTNSTGTTDYTKEFGADFENFEITSYLVYDNEFIYIAEKVVADRAISFTTASGSESAVNTHVRYGMNQSEAIPEFQSRLSNTYAYRWDSANDQFTVTGCTAGNRSYKKLAGVVSQSKTLDTDAYSDWTLAKYGQNTAIGYETDGTSHTYVFEYKIPLVDAVYSAFGEQSPSNLKSILDLGTFFGSYMFQVAVTRTGGAAGNQQMFLSTGFAGGTQLLPYSSADGKGEASTWAKEAKSYWTTEKGEFLSVTYIPSPIVHGSNAGGSAVAPSTGFRPGLTGFRLDKVATAYKLGELATFTVIPDAIENTKPVKGDVRIVPVEFRVRKGYDTEIVGTFEKDFKTGKFQTKELSVGLHTLVVTFLQQKFDGKEWKDTTEYKNLATNFTIKGSVLGAAGQGSSQTGDSTLILAIAGGVMLLSAATVTCITLKKKKVR